MFMFQYYFKGNVQKHINTLVKTLVLMHKSLNGEIYVIKTLDVFTMMNSEIEF